MRHRPILWAVGALFAMLGLLITLVGWSAMAARAASDEASQAARSAESLQIRTGEYRDYMKADMIDLKASMKSMADKQDRMNEHIQRLIQKTDTATK